MKNMGNPNQAVIKRITDIIYKLVDKPYDWPTDKPNRAIEDSELAVTDAAMYKYVAIIKNNTTKKTKSLCMIYNKFIL